MKERLKSLDILRGITIAAMIVVNNPGSWEHMYAPLDHAEWNGVTPTDFIFPFFMFIMGVSMCFSLKRFNYTLNAAAAKKLLLRGVNIYLVGLAIVVCAQLGFRGSLDVGSIRLTGVLARLAICYVLAALVALSVKQTRTLVLVIFTTLVGYTVLLLVGNGFSESMDNLLSRVDVAVLGSHMYAYDAAKDWNFDPEGILSTIPGVAHVLIGFLVGRGLMRSSTKEEKMLKLLLIGGAAIIAAFLLQYGCPLNKKVWSPTFVLMTCGAGCVMIALLTYIIDVKKHERWSYFFHVIGVNPLFCYVMADVYAIGFVAAKLPVGANGQMLSINGIIRDYLITPCFGDEKFGSLMFALFILLLTWIVAWVLFKKKIIVKL